MEELVSEHGISLLSAIMGMLFICITIIIANLLVETQIMELEHLI